MFGNQSNHRRCWSYGTCICVLHETQVSELQESAVNMSSDQLDAICQCMTGIDVDTQQSDGPCHTEDPGWQQAVQTDRSPNVLDTSLEYETNFELKHFRRLPVCQHLIQSVLNERPSSVPLPVNDVNGTAHDEDGVDGVSTDDESDKLRDVDEPDGSFLDVVDSGTAAMEAYGDGIWSDEDCQNTVSKSYVPVKDLTTTQPGNVATKQRYVTWEDFCWFWVENRAAE